MTLSQCQQDAKDENHTKFLITGPAGTFECEWHDPWFGIFTMNDNGEDKATLVSHLRSIEHLLTCAPL